MKEFAARLVAKFRPEAYEKEAMNVGVVQFGNGQLIDNGGGLGGVGIVSDAILGASLTNDTEEVITKIKALKWQRGFTNMAQGISKASHLIKTSYRKRSTGVVIMLTDGRPSFKRSTELAVKKLKQSSVLVIAQIKEFPKEENQKLMK